MVTQKYYIDLIIATPPRIQLPKLYLHIIRVLEDFVVEQTTDCVIKSSGPECHVQN